MKTEILKFFEKMKNINKLLFKSESLKNSQMNWNYEGCGKIKITKENNKLYFLEEIEIKDGFQRIIDKKMWNFCVSNIEFYHFRNGNYQKILDFIVDDNKMILKNKYECIPDYYSGKLEVLEDRVLFIIKIQGSRKNEIIKYEYFSD